MDEIREKIGFWGKKLLNYGVILYALSLAITLNLDYKANPEAYSFNEWGTFDYLATRNTGVMLRAECRPYITFYEFIEGKIIYPAKIFLAIYGLILLIEYGPTITKKFKRLEE